MSKVSKFMSLVLRHDPEKAGLTLNAEGYTSVASLVSAIQEQIDPNFSVGKLDEVVQTNDKKRFEYDQTGTRIRACQGHSIQVDLGLKKEVPPFTLYHGTVPENVASIMMTGINKGTRHAVHLSADTDTATIVGARRGKPIVLKVMAREMHTAGHTFYKSTNGVWLTDFVPAEFIHKKV